MLYAIRTRGGELIPPIDKGTAAAAIVKGAPVYRNVSDGKITGVATNGTKLLGFAQSTTTAADQEIDFTPCYPGVQFLLDFDGTYAITKLGTYVEITVSSGNATANLDESSNDILKLIEVDTNTSTVKRAWFEAATTANQTMIEVA
jgi:hypothetical protein